MNFLLFGIAAYIAVQRLVGLLVSRHIVTECDYLLAARRIGLALGSFFVFATGFGAETSIGAAGSVYRSGLSGGLSNPFGYSTCLFVMGLMFARFIRYGETRSSACAEPVPVPGLGRRSLV